MAPDPYRYFRIEAAELLELISQALLDLDRNAPGVAGLSGLLRQLHTLKGAARVVKQTRIAEATHQMEDLLAPHRHADGPLPREAIDQLLTLNDVIAAQLKALTEAPATTTTQTQQTPTPVAPPIRVARTEVRDVDALLERIDEGVATLSIMRPTLGRLEQMRAWIDRLAKQLSTPGRDGTRQGPALVEARALVRELEDSARRLEHDIGDQLDRFERDWTEVRTTAEGLRLLPVAGIFTTLERAVFDTARTLNKQATFTTRGGDIRIDSEVLFAMQDALVQLVCNAVAHGIETPTERARKKKPERGHVSLEVTRSGSRVVFTCRDDGRGLDVAAVRQAMRDAPNAPPNAERLDADQLLSHLPSSGVSTATRITSVSGRGVGLDIARAAAAHLGGQIRLESTPGESFCVALDVPMSVAAFEALWVGSDSHAAAIPLDAVVRCERATGDAVTQSNDGLAVLHEGKLIPMMPLSALWNDAATLDRTRTLLVIQASSGVFALGVDRLLGTRPVMMRALPVAVTSLPSVAGACLDASGNPLLVLDPDNLALQTRSYRVSQRRPTAQSPRVLVIDDSLTTRMMEQSILESAGYHVELAVSAEDGLRLAQRTDYDLFLVDVEMPGMDGFTFVAQTRADPRLRHVPAVLVSSRSDQEDLARGAAVGAAGYMVKSRFDQRELLALIENLVRSE